MFQDGGEWEIGVPGDRSSQYGARPTLRMNGVDQPTAYPDAYALNDEIKGGELIKLLWDINKTGKEQNDSQAMHDRLGIK